MKIPSIKRRSYCFFNIEVANYVIIQAKDGRLTTYVSFYGEKPGKLTLTDSYQGEVFVDGLICNWRNREEFRLDNLQL